MDEQRARSRAGAPGGSSDGAPGGGSERETASAFAAGSGFQTRFTGYETEEQQTTRLPRYARGKLGVVERRHGGFVYPDSNAAGKGEDPRWLYSVAFAGTELWGPESDPSLSVSKGQALTPSRR